MGRGATPPPEDEWEVGQAREAQRLFDAARDAQSRRDTSRAIALGREALARDADHPGALELVATLLVTRRRRFSEGLGFIERAAAVSYDDAATWYTVGWLYEFAAHESARGHADDEPLDVRALYERAAEAFRRCLSLGPEGKLQGDAEDLLDHVENELSRLAT
jgi:tetratricopeptide (TPR) repeat protein